ncbi:hypothetical protein HX793_10780 [Pseudomonas reactans]|uniref:hypothetical protein n=1 Tax=Pseudomonas reactans TaxID=117680 RepID=UPI0015A3CF0D|nr:hypothetical protein [Pseudomonas reactans]NWC88379.1 hypothetical protein [Pseudomonas reactans]NWD30258.1 hypothetical protein [Pseudomonas reactans]
MRKRAEVVVKWECGNCNELHAWKNDAKQCCRPPVSECWICPACAQAHSDKNDAENYCPDSELAVTCPSCLRDYDLNGLSFHAVRVAAHCTECNPMFTVDQQMAIQDFHYLNTGESRNMFG